MFARQSLASSHHSSGNRGFTSGFTLIEVMIVVAIIGILSAIAYPQYGKFVTKSRRADGHLAMLQAVQSLERCKSTNYSYASCTIDGTSDEGNYTLGLASTATTYTITATGVGPQANDTDCRVMTINQQNIRTPDASNNCWPD